MHKVLLSFATLLLTFFTAQAQIAFQETYGIGIGTDVKTTSDKGFIILGYAEGSTDVITLAKTDSLGHHQWSKSYYSSGTNTLSGNAIEQTHDGGYIVAGTLRYSASGDSDLVLLKFDSAGTLLWNRNFHFDPLSCATDVLETTDFGLIVTGITGSVDPGNSSFLLKTDSSGTFQWAQRIGYTSLINIKALAQTGDGGFITTGFIGSVSATTQTDVVVIKTTAGGTIEWSRIYGGSSIGYNEFGHAIVKTPDGGYAIAGQTSYGAGLTDVYLVKTAVDGSLQWTKTFGGIGADGAYALQVSGDGGFVLAGYTASSGSIDAYLIKTASNGNLQWSSAFGGTSMDEAYAVALATDGGYVLNGYTQSAFATYNPDVYFIKTNTTGQTGCNETFPTTTEGTGGIADTIALTQTALTSTGTVPIYTQFGSISNRLCTLGVDETVSPFSYAIFPNPFSASTTIRPEKTFSNATLVVFNTFGQVVKTVNHISGPAYTLQRENLPAGIYLIQMQEHNTVLLKEKLVVADR